MTQEKFTALIFAMQEEQTGLREHLKEIETITIGKREFLKARFADQAIISALSGIGKVAASITATTILNSFPVSKMIMCGVAGGVHEALKQGDIVIASELLQHDMDASPLFPRFEIPLSGKTKISADEKLTSQLQRAAITYLKATNREESNQVKVGLIASGDQFISNQQVLNKLKDDLPGLMAVEMEGAAIAQVCEAFDLPFSVVRTISDSANDDASLDFQSFIEETAAPYSVGILNYYFANEKISRSS